MSKWIDVTKHQKIWSFRKRINGSFPDGTLQCLHIVASPLLTGATDDDFMVIITSTDQTAVEFHTKGQIESNYGLKWDETHGFQEG
jgi:hypothetical protein